MGGATRTRKKVKKAKKLEKTGRKDLSKAKKYKAIAKEKLSKAGENRKARQLSKPKKHKRKAPRPRARRPRARRPRPRARTKIKIVKVPVPRRGRRHRRSSSCHDSAGARCRQKSKLCNNKTFGKVIRKKCPRTCGTCGSRRAGVPH